MGYDVHAVRARFPALAAGTAHFDGPGGSQVPDTVAAAVADTLTSPLANRGSVTAAERGGTRSCWRPGPPWATCWAPTRAGGLRPQHDRADLRPGPHAGRDLAPGRRGDRHAPRPRRQHPPVAVRRAGVGATVRWAEFDPRTAELTVADVARAVVAHPRRRGDGRVELLAPGPRPADRRRARGARWCSSTGSTTAHAPVDVAALRGHLRLLALQVPRPALRGPAAAPDLLESLTPEKLAPSPDSVPERFELGTLPYELLAGTTAAVDFLAGLDPDATGNRRERLTASLVTVERHEEGLRHRIEDGLAALNKAA